MTPKYPEFNVRIVKDEENTLAKRVRYKDEDVIAIPVRTEQSSATWKEWKNIPLAPAYALTGHKGQGLTMNTTFLGFSSIFGYGLPYTLVTRTPFVVNQRRAAES